MSSKQFVGNKCLNKMPNYRPHNLGSWHVVYTHTHTHTYKLVPVFFLSNGTKGNSMRLYNLRIQSLRLTPERKLDYFLQKYDFVMTK